MLVGAVRPVPLRLTAVALAALGAGGVRAQQYAWRYYGAEAGLPIAYAVAFDGTGALVVGTNDGLVRFDGLTFDPVALPGAEDERVVRLDLRR